jgi:hypothetical protein
MKHFSTAIAAALFSMTAVGFSSVKANADSLPLVGPPNGFSVGTFFPASDKAKQGGNSQFSAELRYGLPSISPIGTRIVSTLGYEGGSDNGKHSTIVPLTIGAFVGSGSFPSQPYFGGGFGIYYADQSGEGVGTRGGGYIGAGYRFSYLYAEARYQFVSGADGALLSVGLTF